MALELYIEKEFLEDLFENYQSNKLTVAQKIFKSIIEDYPKDRVVINCVHSTFKEREDLNQNFPFFSKLFNDSNIEVIIEMYSDFIRKSNCSQTIFFMQKKYGWFDDAEKKGALCFCVSNYEEKINSILSICNNLKIDLSFENEGLFDSFKTLKHIPKNKIDIYDSYIVDHYKSLENFLELFLNKIIDIEIANLNIGVFLIKKLNKKNDANKNDTIVENDIKNKNKVFYNLKNILNENIKLNIQFKYNDDAGANFAHDRIIYSNFFIIECPCGFNNIFSKDSSGEIKYKSTNSKITVDSIFDLFTYKRMNNHSKKY